MPRPRPCDHQAHQKAKKPRGGMGWERQRFGEGPVVLVFAEIPQIQLVLDDIGAADRALRGRILSGDRHHGCLLVF
ncbi:hypothetical protein TM49_00180 [Martelella endophytica]|uniref:Uncharacterized protein n=1 Tax=Martelella endophytica TaxID=1486262 RepID=A0A0D5LJU0_MAREN|nr:hypothetical protein TM49_00180 [Martelella endophytica]